MLFSFSQTSWPKLIFFPLTFHYLNYLLSFLEDLINFIFQPSTAIFFYLFYCCCCCCCLVPESCPNHCDTIDYIACHAPLSVGFPRKEFWSGLPFPSPWDLPDQGIEPISFAFPALAGRFFTTESPGKFYLFKEPVFVLLFSFNCILFLFYRLNTFSYLFFHPPPSYSLNYLFFFWVPFFLFIELVFLRWVFSQMSGDYWLFVDI